MATDDLVSDAGRHAYAFRPAEHMHSKRCLADALIVSIENARDAFTGENGDFEFRLWVQANGMLGEADGYLGMGMTQCRCEPCPGACCNSEAGVDLTPREDAPPRPALALVQSTERGNGTAVWSPENGWHDGPPVNVMLNDNGRITSTPVECDGCDQDPFTEPVHYGTCPLAPKHADYPHEDGRLYDCPACEARCHCDPDPGSTACVFDGPHKYRKGE